VIEAQVYKALGDPVRLEIVKRLASGSPYTIGRLSENLGVSRQGARKQIKVLEAANLLHLTPKGRETIVKLNTARLKFAREYIAKLEAQWEQRLENLKLFAEDQTTED
jgi:DNA-binding transcriptional ArsR family regulator